MLHVPYKGSSPAHVDLMGGRVDIMFDNIVAVRSNLQEGKLRALAVTSGRRAPSLPDVPTMQESGFAGFETTAWFGLLAPAGTPQAAVDKLSAAFNEALNKPAIKQRLADMGAQTVGSTPAEFGTFIDAEVKKWKPVVERAGISM